MVIAKLRNWYGKYERPISSLSLIGGFVFDALTLRRVDLLWENLWVIAHLVIVATAMVLVQAMEKEEGAEANPSKLHFWLVNIIQFFFGGILSTYLVFYFRSSDIAVSWPFILILALAFWANEALKRSFTRLSFQVALLFLSIYCFAIFLVPVTLHKIGPQMFLFSGLLSLVFTALFLWLIYRTSKKGFGGANKFLLFGSIAGIFALVNILYFTNILPPIPLSLKDAGVYYAVQRDGQGNFSLVGEQQTWLDYFKLYPNFDGLTGQPIYVYSAVFAPSGLNTTIIHEWQHKDASTGQWRTIDRISLRVYGGRDGGFRTYSVKNFNLTPGHWRVNVETANGQVIGRVRFNLVTADVLPKLEQKVN
jgi:Protein of unknown function (DUF2914)